MRLSFGKFFRCSGAPSLSLTLQLFDLSAGIDFPDRLAEAVLLFDDRFRATGIRSRCRDHGDLVTLGTQNAAKKQCALAIVIDHDIVRSQLSRSERKSASVNRKFPRPILRREKTIFDGRTAETGPATNRSTQAMPGTETKRPAPPRITEGAAASGQSWNAAPTRVLFNV